LCRGQPETDEDDAVGAVFEQRLDHGALAAGAHAARDEQHAVAEGGRDLLDTARDLGEERVVEIVEQHTHCARPSRGEAARHRVGAIAQLRGGVEHALTPFGADLGTVANH
jgi:hypothetical protein